MAREAAEERELSVEALTTGGRGLSRPGERVWFLPDTFPGDRVLARAQLVRPRFVEGRVLRLLSPSPSRRDPPCRLQSRCGGCPWMPLPESEQRRWKRRLVAETLQRIGRIRDVEVEPTRFGTRRMAYRNRAEFAIRRDGAGRTVVGLHSSGWDSAVVDVDRCLLLDDASNRVLSSAREFLVAGAPPPAGAEFRLVVRRSALTGEVLVALREAGKSFPGAQGLAEHLVSRHPQVCGVVRLQARPGRRGGTKTIPIAGRGWIAERIGGVTFRLPAASFVQVNAEVASMLVAGIVECAGTVEGGFVLDLYGGVGVNGLALASRGARVTVCDADREAVECGAANARRHGLVHVRYSHSDAAAFLRRSREYDLIVANPPRTGLGRGVAEGISAGRASRVILVSCDPATQARDVRRLVDRGFRLETVVPYDLFPQTAHVETLISMVRPRGSRAEGRD